MVDVDRRFPASHAAGLRRLSSRAASSSTSTTRIAGLHSFTSLASSLIDRLQSSGIPLSTPGLSEPELLRIESHFNFSFPPDLRAFLSLALPSSPSFPQWRRRSPLLPSLSLLFSLPLLALSINQSCGLSRASLKRAPLLIPVFSRCYIPCRPSLAGNPVFYVDEDRIFCCAVDLQDFVSKIADRLVCPPPVSVCCNDRVPRWIEFWSDAAALMDRRRRSSSSSSVESGPDPERFVEIRPAKVPHWMGRYMEEIGSVLKDGGWGEEEVEEMVHVSASCALDCEEDAVVDALVLRADRWKEELRTAGWEEEEVAEFLNLEIFESGDVFGRKKAADNRRKVVSSPPHIQSKMQKLAEEFTSW